MTNSVYVSNIDYKVTPEELGKAFEKFGPLSRAIILTERYHGQLISRGIGFVDFQDANDAAKAVAATGTIAFNGRNARVQPARPRRPRTTLFVGGIPAGTTVDQMKAAFASHNPVNARVVKENTEERRGFGFVLFNSEEDIKAIIAKGRNVNLNGGESIIRIARVPFNARPHGHRPYHRGYRRAPRANQ